MADTSLRKILMLSHLPRSPLGICAAELQKFLSDAGHEVHLRTIQRDLQELSTHFPLISTKNNGKHLWSWAEGATSLSLPNMTADEALALFLVERYVYELLPPQVAEHLESRFDQAREVLNQSAKLKTWTDRVYLLSRSPAMLPPKIDPTVLMKSYEGLQKDVRLKLTYAKDTRGGSKEFDFSPLGMLLDGDVMYLVGLAREYEDVVSLALHRIQKCELTATRSRKLKGFRLEDYARESLFDLAKAGSIKLHLRVRGRLVRYLTENRLGSDQELTRINEKTAEVRVTTNDASPLRWWLLSWGDKVEILAPAALRREFAKTAKSLSEMYSK
jgi:predicted DNA-binding transcriptional regulator YafY